MDFVLDELKCDSSKGHSFKILFEQNVSLEIAVEKLSDLYQAYTQKPIYSYADKKEIFGLIKTDDSSAKELRIHPLRRGEFRLMRDLQNDDTYLVRENGFDFDEFEKLYEFIESRF